MANITRNGKAYDSADVQVFIEGIEFFEVIDLKYSNAQEHQLNHSLAAIGTSYSLGKITPTASITLWMKDSVKLEKLGNGSLLNLRPLSYQVTYTNEDNEIISDRVIAKFQDEGREVTGDMGLKRTYDLFALSVDLNY